MPRAAGSGIKKGQKQGRTLDKLAAREVLRQMIIANLTPMAEAQMANARGIKFLMVREKKTGKFLRVGEIGAGKLNPNEEIIEVWEKEPSIQAFTDLMNRALDKPSEHVELTGAGGAPLEVRWRE